jgi:cytidylate kinase
MSSNCVITIARGYGSSGRMIGKLVAKELDIPFYDRSLIYMASEESGINVDLFGKADEKLKSGLFGRVTDKYTGGVIPPESADFVSDKNLFNYQAKIIKELAQKGPCVIVGRCADYILKDNPNLIKAFIYAPLDYCVKSIMERRPMLSAKEAEKEVKKVDAYRSEYYKHYSGQDWKNFDHYDLCLNSSSLGVEKCAKMIESYIDIKSE